MRFGGITPVSSFRRGIWGCSEGTAFSNQQLASIGGTPRQIPRPGGMRRGIGASSIWLVFVADLLRLFLLWILFPGLRKNYFACYPHQLLASARWCYYEAYFCGRT